VFRQTLNGLGYVEGKNYVMELRYSETAESQAQGAEELVRLGVDIILVTTSTSALAAQRATKTIPIVMISVGNPFRPASWKVWLGLVATSQATQSSLRN